MTKDLTDHVRERDESEGPPMKPITDTEAEAFLGLFDSIDPEPWEAWQEGGKGLGGLAYVITPRGELCVGCDKDGDADMGMAAWIVIARSLAPRLLADRTVMLEILEGLYLSLLHGPPPEKAHEGSCHPDAGCDGLCADAYSHDMLLEKARALLAAVKGGE